MPILTGFKLNTKMRKMYNFKMAALFSDTVVARNFEGLPVPKPIASEKIINLMRSFNKRS
jgi:hypothetical protein